MNEIKISGRLGRDPELKTGASGNEFCTFSLAVDRWHKKGEEKQTDWFNCTAFGATGIYVSTYIKKGDWVLISGRMQCEKKDDKQYWNCLVEKIERPSNKPSESKSAPIPEAIPMPDDMPF